MAQGVKVVGAHGAQAEGTEPSADTAVGGGPAPPAQPSGAARPRRGRGWATVLAVVAVLGIAGTVGFGLAWAGLKNQQSGEAQARSAAKSFLVDLTNFDAKTVDADFGAVTSMATGPFASQAQKFFNSSIRQELQKALASSRGQVRALYVQDYGAGQATVYGVVDQLYVNDKITAPRTDVLRIVLTMADVRGRWKVADVTVLQGPSPVSGSSSTGGTGSSSSTTTPTTGASTGS